MKRASVFLTLGILMISLTLALEPQGLIKTIYDWDNTKSIKNIIGQEYPEITIKSNFGFGGDVWKGRLTKNTNTCSVDCSAEKNITLTKPTELISDIRFKTLQEDNLWVEQPIRSYQFYIKNESSRGWKYYNIGEVLDKGTYTLKLEGKKKPSRTVDWQIKTNGQWLDEWAVWNGIPTVYDEIDDSSVNTSLWDTATSSSSAITGKIIENTDYINLYGQMEISTGGSASETLTSNNITSNLVDIESLTINVNVDASSDSYSGGVSQFTMFGNLIKQISNSGSDTSVWKFIKNMSSGSIQFDVYDDDVYQNTITPSNNVIQLYAYQTMASSSIWSFGSAKIYYVYYNDSNIILNSPLNASISNSVLNVFNSSATIGGGATLVNMSLYTNETGSWAIRNSTTGLSTNTSTQSWSRTLNDNEYLWNVQACDSDGDCGFAPSNFSFSIDASAPQITINTPSGTLDFGIVGNNETLNWTVTDSSLDSVWYNYNGTNISVVGSSNATNFTLESNNLNLTLYANDTTGNENSSFVNWSYKIFEESRNFNSSTFETASEDFIINLTTNSSLTAVTLDYNGTEYSATQSGTNWTSTIDIPLDKLQNNSIRWKFTYGAETIYSSYFFQNVSSTVFVLCNATYSTPFLNLTFKDEADSSVINASIPTSTFVYWLGSGTVNKTLTFINNTENLNYTFCAIPTNRVLSVDPIVQYKQGTTYPQRTWDPSTQQYNGTIDTEQILYLLSTADGLYVTFQVINPAEQPVSGVEVTATRVIGSDTVIVAQGTTDAAGTVTFWLNPDFEHTLTFVKSGYSTLTQSLTPTQSTYTVTLGGGTTVGISDYSQGISSSTRPIGTNVLSNTSVDFNYTISSSFWSLEKFGFILSYSNGTIIGSTSSTSDTGGTINITIITPLSGKIVMDYYYIINSTYINDSTSWLVYTGSDFSINYFLTDLITYIDADVFGILGDDEGYFTKAILSILLIILISGTISLRYGLASEQAVSSLIFGTLLFLNTFNFIPTPAGLTFVDLGDFLVMLTAVMMIATIFREELR